MPLSATYEPIRQIHRNDQGFVGLCLRNRDRKLIVHKSIKHPTYDDDQEQKPTEVEILSRALRDHPRILSLEDWELTSPFCLNLYFRYCEGGDLHQFTEVRGNPRWEEDFVWHVFVEMAEALAFCREWNLPSIYAYSSSLEKRATYPDLSHLDYGYDRNRADPYKPPRNWRRVVHRDIKPNNIFVQTKFHPRGPYPHLILGDFGVATFEPYTVNAPFTSCWSAPEWPSSSAKSDVWQLGAIVHYLCHGQNPTIAHSKTGFDDMRWLQSAESKRPLELPRRYSDELNGNMMVALEEVVEERVNSRALLRHLVKVQTRAAAR